MSCIAALTFAAIVPALAFIYKLRRSALSDFGLVFVLQRELNVRELIEFAGNSTTIDHGGRERGKLHWR
jgi:hypothetical protein